MSVTSFKIPKRPVINGACFPPFMIKPFDKNFQKNFVKWIYNDVLDLHQINSILNLPCQKK